MVTFYDEIPPKLAEWIMKQEMFFTATATLRADGHVNVSPKGVRGAFHMASPTRVWYEDLTGSGSETMSHLRENGRITIMFNAFEGPPCILRLFGTGIIHEFGSPEYDNLIPPETRRPGSRCAVVIDVHKVATSCGYGVPRYTFQAQRSALLHWCANLEKKDQKHAAEGSPGPFSPNGMKAWWTEQNVSSLDSEPAMLSAHISERMLVYAPWDDEKEGIRPFKSGLVAESDQIEADAAKAETKSMSGEISRLVLAFSVGVAATAVYIRLAGVPCSRA